MATLKWNGREIVAKMAAAAAAGIDRTMSECVHDARREHSYVNRDGFLESSTDIIRHAGPDGMRVVGNWGSTADYALFVEIGTSRIGPTAPEREAADGGDMWAVPAQQPAEGVRVLQPFTILPPGTMPGQEGWVTLHRPSMGTGNPGLMAQRPFLRPAADREYPLLAPRIGAAFRGEQMP
ncbi:MAG: hypothetical protein ACYCQK_01650 [Acidiferrobacteraceae bacterium]